MQLTTAWQKIVRVAQAHLDRSQRGSSIVEYALLVTLIAVVCLLALDFLGGTTSDSYSQYATSMAAANS